ncbi:hypothetical protein Rhe02_27320 [Rhizocola hellebori]|uniref:Mycodextranase n=1 Tax=Rhizocola hellebori TaxID=1392758 RepID=A0A8J3Q6D7_9ACTN|nr:right-handed parallel beta-helix repeat-containing protein [Rhizocola hellebori]GIH04665.1 hypothetical protein Rhe02_27320 [Rhizocola hellebori]
MKRVAAWIALALVAACSPTPAEPTAPPKAELAFAVAGRGAAVSFVEYEAEAADFQGTLIGPTRAAKTLAGESSGRMAVTLAAASDHVSFTLVQSANAVTVRASVPDGTQSSLRVSAGGETVKELPLTSKYSWYYGGFPFTNNPSDGSAHHFYDHARALLGVSLAAGTKVSLNCACTIDLADFEEVAAPLEQPAGSKSIVDFGADPTGGKDSSDAIDAALAQSRDAWIPAGTFKVTRHLEFANAKLRGAGMWHSTLTGPGVGVYARKDGNIHLTDFAIIGEVAERDDKAQLNGVGGAPGNGSTVERLFIQHTKVGMWLDGPFDGLTVRGNRIFDTTADGLNLHQGISNAIVEHNVVRNTGDDGMAMWSDQNPNHHNVFRNNTVQLPMLANGIGIYGGHDNAVTGNVVADVLLEGAGIQIANRFSGTVALSGTTKASDNTVLRGGSKFPGIQADVGAIFLFGKDSPITGVVELTGNRLIDSSYSGLHLFAQRIEGVSVDRLIIERPGTVGVQIQSTGSAKIDNSRVAGGVYLCADLLPFVLTVTNSEGLDTPKCAGI